MGFVKQGISGEVLETLRPADKIKCVKCGKCFKTSSLEEIKTKECPKCSDAGRDDE